MVNVIVLNKNVYGISPPLRINSEKSYFVYQSVKSLAELTKLLKIKVGFCKRLDLCKSSFLTPSNSVL